MSLSLLNIIAKEQEPNPFEESFSSVTTKFKAYEPPTNHPHGGNPVNPYYNSFSNNDSYSTVSDQHTTSEDSDDHSYMPPNQSHSYSFYDPTLIQSQQSKAQFVNMSYSDQPKPRQYNKSKQNKPKRVRKPKVYEDEEKRKDFLERNRLAALKCRQRKKQWLSNLQTRVEYLTNDNEHLQMEAESLKNEIMELKTLLLAHKDCPQYSEALKSSQLQDPSQSILYHHAMHLQNNSETDIKP